MTKAEVLRLFLIMNNAYPNFDADDTKTEMWQRFLEVISFEDAERNLLKHIRTSSFQPTPADILRVNEKPEGPYVPGVKETQDRLRLLGEMAARATPPPWLREGGKKPWLQ